MYSPVTKLKQILLSLAFAGIAGAILPVYAQDAASVAPDRNNPQDANYAQPEKGWFFFEGKKEEKPEPAPEEAPPAAPEKPAEPEKPKEDKCLKKETWSADCGFVNPGQDFSFQAKQRDALLERMVVSNNDPKAVEDFQYYMRWVLERVVEVTNLWQFNMAQNPELNPQTQMPISTMGLRLMTDVQSEKESEIAKLLQTEGAFLVYFSRNDCKFCHEMSPLIRSLGDSLGIPVRNAALDATCMQGFEEGCVPNAERGGQMLQVAIVPTVFLHVPKNTWIRIATGVEPMTVMKERIMQFFLAYRTALLKGVVNGQNRRASVDFSQNEEFMGGASKGVTLDKSAPLPTESDIAKMLGAE